MCLFSMFKVYRNIETQSMVRKYYASCSAAAASSLLRITSEPRSRYAWFPVCELYDDAGVYRGEVCCRVGTVMREEIQQALKQKP